MKRHFVVELSEPGGGGTPKADAIVYDIPKLRTTIDLRLLKNLRLPTVILACETSLRFPGIAKCRVLSYPVKPEAIIRALEELGITPERSP